MTDPTTEPDLSSRQSFILERVARTGFVTIEALASELAVSAQTVRRDIIALAQAGRLQRFHGGAGPVDGSGPARLDYHAKRDLSRPEKKIVGMKAAAAIPDNAALFLDVGTTIECCAAELAKRPGFLIFTNSIRAAMMFDPLEHQVHVLGGRLAGRDGSLTGEEVVLALREVQLDYALIACSAIDERRRVMDFDFSKIAVKKAAMSVSRQAFLLVTTSKLGRTALGAIALVDEFDQVFTEEG
ncbi:MAG: DeoR/GlpR family DNA-binding transcription regulator [Pseudomonadota bacterium]